MKQLSIALLGVLTALHLLGGADALATPLSMFRDGRHAWLGYAAFALLILMGLTMARASIRCRERAAGGCYLVAICMLVFIAATPSHGPLHLVVSLLLPLMLYGYYLSLLYRDIDWWLFVHCSVPLVLMFVTQFHSFGAWQKSMIIYFGLVANLHYSLLPHPVRKQALARRARQSNWDRNERLIAEGWITPRSPSRAAGFAQKTRSAH